MGNVSSVETLTSHDPTSRHVVTSKPTKRQPQKLSKPRVGNHVASRNQSSFIAVSPSSSASQLPTNPNVGPLATRPHSAVLIPSSSSSPMHSPAPPSLVSPAAMPGSEAGYGASTTPQDREISSGLFRSKSTSANRPTRRSTWSTPLSGVTPKRANTMDCQMSEATLERLQPQDSPSPPIPRVHSVASLHAPVRRRSILRTPGLATRAATEETMPRKFSFRQSHPATPASTRSRCDSVVSTPNYLSLPSPCLNPRVQVDIVQTPSEAEYKQLGAMQFGSLRITNGTASPAPSTEGEAVDKGQSQGVTMKPGQVQSAGHAENQMEGLALMQPEPSKDALPLVVSEVEMSEYGHANVWSESEGFSNEVPEIRQDSTPSPIVREQRDKSDKRAHLDFPQADSGIVANPTDYVPGVLSKTDSGYSSATSLRSLRSKSSKKGNGLGAQETHKAESEVSDGSSSTAEGRMSTILADWKSPGLAAAEMPPSEQPRDGHASVTGHKNTGVVPHPQGHGASQPRKLRRKSQSLLLTASHGRPGLLSSQSEHPGSLGLDDSSPILNVEPGPSKKYRFQWLMGGPKANGHPALQPMPGNRKTMVSVLQDSGPNYSKHGDQLSIIDRRATLHSPRSRDTLQTILSDGSAGLLGDTSVSRAKPQPSTREGSKVLRRHSSQSSSTTPLSLSLTPKPSIRRKPWSWGQKSKAEEVQLLDGGDWVKNSFESSVTSIDSISSSVGKSAFDQAFAAMSDKSNDELPPSKLSSMTMPVPTERILNLRRKSSSGSRSPGRIYVSSSRSSPIPEVPGMPPQNVTKAKTPPPVSLRRHNSKAFRLPRRPQSTPADPTHRNSDRPSSRGSSNNEKGPAPPPVPPMPSKKPAQYPELQHLKTSANPDYDAWRPKQLSRRHSVGDNAGAAPELRRPASADHGAGLGRPTGPRQRASYDGLGKDRQRCQYDPPQTRHNPVSQNPTQSGSYYQNQLLRIERNSLGDEPWRQQRHSFGGRARHSRAGVQGTQGPYRILHSYNSPAYRNVPIWG
ncbi:hypothetical protein SODALDRAFT_201305 [Sodiomyces alkalinus F11]|uniref:Uncharacterized protein n=1 Tax=Sodiomyces alkalinus (strain CBS 110278 / VKM F-3762 / F11) TaxID=1314773 RepID=A0A3N2PT13_SODAK|nr:hypothetical protein SODALDRAFT_201305 [Sodiomyces alkalinus F11]ROT37621.1 hypothetical protein SODALDRAFT_201305 [Sodiomyces alkalinus F11]